MVIQEKSVGIGIILALIFVGAGQLYAEKIARGIALLVAWMFLMAPMLAVVMLLGTIGGLGSMIGAMIIALIIYVAVWVWTIYDAMQLIKKYNAALRSTGRPPW